MGRRQRPDNRRRHGERLNNTARPDRQSGSLETVIVRVLGHGENGQTFYRINKLNFLERCRSTTIPDGAAEYSGPLAHSIANYLTINGRLLSRAAVTRYNYSIICVEMS